MNIDTILNLMERYNLTADELLLIYLTILARDEEGHSELFEKWYKNGGKDRLKSIFNSLKEKGVIIKSYNCANYTPNEIKFNKTFLKFWIKSSGELGRELFNNYPPFIQIDNKLILSRDISKKFNSLDDFFFFYSSQIGHNPELHKEILDLLEWGKQNGYINISILNFVLSHQWEALRELRDNPNNGFTATNICTDA